MPKSKAEDSDPRSKLVLPIHEFSCRIKAVNPKALADGSLRFDLRYFKVIDKDKSESHVGDVKGFRVVRGKLTPPCARSGKYFYQIAPLSVLWEAGVMQTVYEQWYAEFPEVLWTSPKDDFGQPSVGQPSER